jgi:hypothetical protein
VPWRVRGLGLTDVLELTLEPIQVPWLLDELDAIRERREEALQLQLAAGGASGDEHDALVDEREYELRLLGMMRERFRGRHAVPTTLVGPSGLVEEAVRGAMRRVLAALSDLAAEPPARDADERLRELSGAADMSIRTYLDCKAVTGFNFDSEADPMRAW